MICFEPACLPNIEERGPVSVVPVVVFRQTDIFFALFGLNIVEIAQGMFSVGLLDPLTLCISGGRIVIVDTLQIAAMRMLIDFEFSVWQSTARDGPTLLPFRGVLVLAPVVAWRLGNGLIH